MGRPLFLAALLGVGLSVTGLMGCGGEVAKTDLQGPGSPSDLPSVDESWVDATWPVRTATEAELAPYVSEAGWTSLVMRRDYKRAVQQLGASGGLPAARAHDEAAAVFRQASLLSAWSLIETFGNTPEPTDPVGVAHLLSVSYALTGDLDKAREWSARLDGVDDPTTAWHAPWKAWLAGDASWPPDLSGLPHSLGEPSVGGWPSTLEAPHYALPEQGVETRREMGDPGALVALALWHDAAAQLAAGDEAPAIRTYRAAYHLPIEPPVEGVELPDALLFGSDLLVPGDGPFLAALHGEAGAAAVEAHKDSSLMAWMAHESRVDGTIHAERAVDLVTRFRDQLIERAAARTDGAVQGHHRQFADIAYVGAFRTLALVAEVEGMREVSGRLRINAMERSEKATACPVGLLALGAWDASNRYPTRAQEILHSQARVFPSLEVARYGLDVMALRVSRERTGETPGM